ncbi:MAG: hypothetical protein AAGC43_18330 [Bacteroidota bacterium]
MSQPTSKDIKQNKLERFDRVLAAIKALEKQQKQLLKQGKLAPEDSWVARYQVRQNTKKYWYYKLQAIRPAFKRATSDKRKYIQAFG